MSALPPVLDITELTSGSLPAESARSRECPGCRKRTFNLCARTLVYVETRRSPRCRYEVSYWIAAAFDVRLNWMFKSPWKTVFDANECSNPESFQLFSDPR